MAMRAQAYPEILNDDGIEWKAAKIAELKKQLADTLRENEQLKSELHNRPRSMGQVIAELLSNKESDNG